jgi:hypothetical protein
MALLDLLQGTVLGFALELLRLLAASAFFTHDDLL